jgi:hypothetical protein
MGKDYLDELLKEGLVVIPDYFSQTKCNKLISEINDFSRRHRIISERDEGMGGDIRVFNYEEYSSDALSFANDEFLLNIVSKYIKNTLETKSVLAGKVVFKNEKMTNSGGDWHRDGDVSQMKAMIYLSDVKSENGPFTFIKNSKDFDFKRRDIKYPLVQRIIFKIKGLPIKPPRYKHDEIINQPEMKENIFKVLGKAGTLVLFDGRYIHRGDVIKSGFRYSLTNYYYPLIKKDIIFYIKGFIKNILSLNSPIINNKHEKK